MREYELVFIVHPDLDDTALKDVVDKVSGWITEAGGIISKVDLWGKRKLAYAIRKQKEGQYVLMRTQHIRWEISLIALIFILLLSVGFSSGFTYPL